MARLLDEIVGHEQQLDHLFQLYLKKRWPHALLFIGPSGVGKKKIAWAMAQKLTCEAGYTDESQAPCGVCGSCIRASKHQSEGIFFIEPSTEVARPTIKVDIIRDLLHSLSLAKMSRSQVVIIDSAHLMNEQAANALLKTLEEPKEGVYFILIGEDLESFMPTIRSRSQVLRFGRLKVDHLMRLRPQLSSWMYSSSRGQVTTLDLFSASEGSQKRLDSFEFFERFCLDQEFLLGTDWRQQIKEKTWAIFNITFWIQIVRDLFVFNSGLTDKVVNQDQIEKLKQLQKIKFEKWSLLSTELILAEQALRANADPVLTFEKLWVKYARVD